MVTKKPRNQTLTKQPLLDFSGTEPWFKPKRFWKYWAAYYPVSWHGWSITLFLIATLLVIYIIIALKTSSMSLIIARFLPFLFVALIFYDHMSLKRGLYPSWWKKTWRKENTNKADTGHV